MKKYIFRIAASALTAAFLFCGCTDSAEEPENINDTVLSAVEEPAESSTGYDDAEFKEKLQNLVNGAKRRLSKNKSGKDIEKLLGEVRLSPIKTNCKKLDDRVGETLNKIIKEDMSNYEMVKACYVYIIGYVSYGRSGYSDSYKKMMSEYSYWCEDDKQTVNSAYSAFFYHKGTCFEYASAFSVMLRRLGFDSNVVRGKVISKNGGYVEHAWVSVKINGEKYLFDPQLEKSNPNKDGSIQYTYFGITYDYYDYLYTDYKDYNYGNFIRK